MSREDVKLPNLPEGFLEISYTSNGDKTARNPKIQNGLMFPLCVNEIKNFKLKHIELLSINADHKDVIEAVLDLEDETVEFQPGDTVGIIPSNNTQEVEEIFSHLGLSDKLDERCILSVVNLADSQNKKPKTLPPHLPKLSTLREIFETCVEIRGPPKKIFLRVLAEFASNPLEKDRLQKLCSREGSAEYERVFSSQTGGSPGFGLLQFFNAFPSCCPPVSILLQHLPRLRARAYSIASSPLDSSKCIRIIFSVYKEQMLKGVCTSWLESFLPAVDLEDQLASLRIDKSPPVVPLYIRKSLGFRLPGDLSVPIIMVGPGTGIAPYIGFLEHISALKRIDESMKCADVWLFYGCRHPKQSLMYDKYLKNFVASGVITRLFLSFSQYSGSFDGWNGSKHVQDSINTLAGEFVEQLIDKNAVLYVSGDGALMFKDVKEKITALIEEHKGVAVEEASSIVKSLVSQKKYLEDVWT